MGLDTTRFGARVPGVPESTAVAELLRVLKPGDQILITVPYGCVADRGWYRVLDRVALDALLAPASGHDLSLQFFYYDRGWFEGGANGPDVARYVPPDSDLIVVAIAYLIRARASSGVDAR